MQTVRSSHLALSALLLFQVLAGSDALADSKTIENENNKAVSESQPYPPGQSLLNLTAGQVGIDRHLESPWRYGVEYRMAPVSQYRLVPSFGLAWTSDDANFIYAELRRDFHLGGRWLLTPSFGVGRFNSQPDLDLGLPLEFRSGLELSYRFDAGYRLGAAIFHLSNGGLSEENPGTEAAVISFSLPFP